MRRALKLLGKLDRRDFSFWGVTYGLAATAFVLIYAAALRLPPPGYRFSGFLHASHDMYSYMAWSRAFSDPGFLADNPYALTPQPGAYFNLYWFAIGKLMRFTGLPFLPLLYVSGLLSGGIMYLALLAFMRQFLPRRSLAWLAYLLAGFGSGVGWIVFLIPASFDKFEPNDITNPELLPFHDFLAYPHVTLSFGLMVFVYLWAYQGVMRRDWGRTIPAGMALIGLGFFHPFHLVTIVAVLGTFSLAMTLRHRKAFLSRWAHPAFLAMTALPPLAYFKFYLLRSPNFQSWGTQIINRTYGLYNALIGFGPHVLLAVAGVALLVKARRCPDSLLYVLVWGGVSLFLTFGHTLFNFRARMLQGFMVPVSILAAMGFAALFSRFVWGRTPGGAAGLVLSPHVGPNGEATWPPTPKFFLWAVPLVLLAMPSHAVVVANQLLVISGKEELFQGPINSKIIVRNEEAAAFDYLRRNINDGSLVMSTMHPGVALPAFARVRSFMGHFQGTPGGSIQKHRSMEFYHQPARGEAWRQRADEMGVDYVWYGPDEVRGLLRPYGLPYLQEVFGNGTVSIFRVVHGPGYRKGS